MRTRMRDAVLFEHPLGDAVGFEHPSRGPVLFEDALGDAVLVEHARGDPVGFIFVEGDEQVYIPFPGKFAGGGAAPGAFEELGVSQLGRAVGDGCGLVTIGRPPVGGAVFLYEDAVGAAGQQHQAHEDKKNKRGCCVRARRSHGCVRWLG